MQPLLSTSQAVPTSLKRIAILEKPRFQVKSTSFDQSNKSSKASLKMQNSLNTSHQSVGLRYHSELNSFFEKECGANQSQLKEKELFAHSDSNICELLEIGNEFSAYPPRDASMRAFSKLEASNTGSRKQVKISQVWELKDEGPQTSKLAGLPVAAPDRNIGSAASPVVMTKKATSRLTQEETDPLDFYEMGRLASAEMVRKHACYAQQSPSNNLMIKPLSKASPIFMNLDQSLTPTSRDNLGRIPWKKKNPQDGLTFSPLKSRQYKLLMVEGHSKQGPFSRLKQDRSPSGKKQTKPMESTETDKLLVSEDIPPTEPTSTKGCFLLKKKKKAKLEIAKENLQSNGSLGYNIFDPQTPEVLEKKITKILQKDDSNLRNIYFMGMLRKLCRVQQNNPQRGESSGRSRRSSRQPMQQTEVFGVFGKKPATHDTIAKIPMPAARQSSDAAIHSRKGVHSTTLTYKELAAANSVESLTLLQEVALKQSLAKRSFDLSISKKRMSSLDKSGPRKQTENQKNQDTF